MFRQLFSTNIRGASEQESDLHERLTDDEVRLLAASPDPYVEGRSPLRGKSAVRGERLHPVAKGERAVTLSVDAVADSGGACASAGNPAFDALVAATLGGEAGAGEPKIATGVREVSTITGAGSREESGTCCERLFALFFPRAEANRAEEGHELSGASTNDARASGGSVFIPQEPGAVREYEAEAPGVSQAFRFEPARSQSRLSIERGSIDDSERRRSLSFGNH